MLAASNFSMRFSDVIDLYKSSALLHITSKKILVLQNGFFTKILGLDFLIFLFKEQILDLYIKTGKVV